MKYATSALIAVVLILSFTAAQKKEDKKLAMQTTPAGVSFSKDVMPVLKKKCLDCHTTDDDNSNNFYVDSYDLLFKESKHGMPITPGKGEASMMIKKLRGTADFGTRMPKRGKLVPDSLVDLISKWIDQGAKKN
jgi:hypothetical protein